MKPLKLNSFHKLVCFVLIVILVISVVGFAVDGWQGDQSKVPDSGDVSENTDNTDENKDGTQNAEKDPSSIGNNSDNTDDSNGTSNGDTSESPTVFTNPITGLVVTEEEYNSLPIGVIINPSAPLYSVSNSDLAIEFPIEDGSTRLLTYLSGEEILWKIGSLSASRKFISGMSDFFGGIVVCYGNDDKVTYNAWQTSDLTLDLSVYSDAYYAENTLYVYTSESMINTALNRNYDLALSTEASYKSAPYSFVDESSAAKGTTAASTLIIPFSTSNETELYYHEASGKYIYYKSGIRKLDMLTGENTAFANIFILFADATTYEKSEGTELVIDTYSGGKGYYVSGGTLTEFKWSVSSGGSLEFKSLSGETLKVNTGNAYIAYFKSANSSAVKFF